MNERILFEAAIEIVDREARRSFLEKACAGNPALLAEVLSLLASHDGLHSFLENSPVKAKEANKNALFDLTTDHTEPDTDHQNTDIATILALLTPSTKPDALGELGHYGVIKSLGQGGFGTVLKAFDSRLHRAVAIKILSPTLAVTSPPRKRFLREARSGAAINHENVVQVYSVEEHPLPYLVMEFVDGYTLQDKMNHEGPFDLPELVNIGRQIASGLAAAHALGLIHRDIKPNNILLANGIEPKVKITDFGLARSADDASLTRSGMVVGTPMYMAPEQARAEKLDHRADLFSFGSVLYAMACGHPPFRAPNTLAVLRRVAEDTPRPLQEWIPELPAWLVALIDKLLAKNPDQRFQNAQEVAEILRWHQNQLQANRAHPAPSVITANIPTEVATLIQPQAELAPGGRRRLLRIGGGVLGFLLLLAGIAIYLKSRNGVQVVRVNESVPASKPAIISAKGPATKGIEVETTPREKWDTPEFRLWAHRVSNLPAHDQLEEFKKKMMELNPGYDGTIHGGWWNLPVNIEDDRVLEVGFPTRNVTNISPVRVFPYLQALNCAANGDGSLTDLSPLHGMELRVIVAFSNKNLKNLSALKGMPLTHLSIFNTSVSDLTPLKDAPLSDLIVANTKVSDLTPVADCPLKWLEFQGAPVADITMLKSRSFTKVSTNTKPLPKGFERLRGLESLREFIVGDEHIGPDEFWRRYDDGNYIISPMNAEASKTPEIARKERKPINSWKTPAFKRWIQDVAGMTAEDQGEAIKKKLVELNPGYSADIAITIKDDKVWRIACDGSQLTDLSFLRALPNLYQFAFYNENPGKVTDLSPLRGINIPSLWLDRTPISDLSPLREMQLRQLSLTSTKITDLSPLSDMTIQYLCLSKCPVSNLSPLKNTRLSSLNCSSTFVADLSPLENHMMYGLILNDTPLTDLTPLKNVPLGWLHIHDTRVSDLSPLKGKHFEELYIHNSKVTDLSPLQDMEILRLSFSPKKITKGLEFVRKMKSLESIRVDGNGDPMPPAEFWKKYDAGEFGRATDESSGSLPSP